MTRRQTDTSSSRASPMAYRLSRGRPGRPPSGRNPISLQPDGAARRSVGDWVATLAQQSTRGRTRCPKTAAISCRAVDQTERTAVRSGRCARALSQHLVSNMERLQRHSSRQRLAVQLKPNAGACCQRPLGRSLLQLSSMKHGSSCASNSALPRRLVGVGGGGGCGVGVVGWVVGTVVCSHSLGAICCRSNADKTRAFTCRALLLRTSASFAPGPRSSTCPECAALSACPACGSSCQVRAGLVGAAVRHARRAALRWLGSGRTSPSRMPMTNTRSRISAPPTHG